MIRENVLVSACLLGVDCTYDRRTNRVQDVEKLMKCFHLVPVCPEQLGGLPTPRPGSELFFDSQYIWQKLNVKRGIYLSGPEISSALAESGECLADDINGRDVTFCFVSGAMEALKICLLYNVSKAIMKERSPSCGSTLVHDGSHSGRMRQGMGLTSCLLKINGIRVYSEADIPVLVEQVENKKGSAD